jgi:TPR repeat protein
LLIKSNEQGYKLAPLSLFSLYAYEKDFEEEAVKKAIEIGEKIASEGNMEMQYELAKLYTTELHEEGKMLDASRSRYWYAKAALQGHNIAYGALNFEPMWEGQEYEDDEDLMNEIKEMFVSDEEDYEDEGYDDEDDGSLGFIPIVTNEKGEKHVDFFSLRLAGREDEYEELEAKLQEMLKNENE